MEKTFNFRGISDSDALFLIRRWEEELINLICNPTDSPTLHEVYSIWRAEMKQALRHRFPIKKVQQGATLFGDERYSISLRDYKSELMSHPDKFRVSVSLCFKKTSLNHAPNKVLKTCHTIEEVVELLKANGIVVTYP